LTHVESEWPDLARPVRSSFPALLLVVPDDVFPNFSDSRVSRNETLRSLEEAVMFGAIDRKVACLCCTCCVPVG
jgi:hypothetical protein